MCKVIFLKGEHIYLRPLEREDINEDYLSWVNDQEVTRYMETGTFPTNMDELENHYNTSQNRNCIRLAIMHTVNTMDSFTKDVHIGNIKLDIDWINQTGCLGIMIGQKEFWGKGFGVESCKLLVRYAFDRLNLRKVWLGVNSRHKDAIKTYEYSGFHEEAVMVNQFLRDDKMSDKIIMSVFR